MDVPFTTLVVLCAPLVAPETMGAIVATESNFRPFVIGVNAGAGFPAASYDHKTKGEAIARARDLLARGANLDLGLAQINSANLVSLGATVEDMFDACKNLRAASIILHQAYRGALSSSPNSREALLAAISAYNTGNFNSGFGNGYVARVQTAVTDVYGLEGVRIMTPDDPPAVPQLAAARPEGAAGDDNPVVVEITKPTTLPTLPMPVVATQPATPTPPEPPAWNVYAHSNRAKTMVFKAVD